VVYVKNADYVPRNEPPSWASGDKVVKVDRVEWLYIPDAMTKVAALNAGEADWWENPPADVWPVLAANPAVTVARVDPLSAPIMVRFNHTQPPFDNPKMRQAVLSVVDQADFLAALASDEKNWERCASFFTCGTPMANDAGLAALTGKRDFDKAKKMIAEVGYRGERIVVMDAVDQPVAHTQALVVTELLKKLGFDVDLQAMDWGTLVTRRPRRSRSTRAATTFSPPAGSAPTYSTRWSTCRSRPMEPMPGSAGPATTSWRTCALNGSR